MFQEVYKHKKTKNIKSNLLNDKFWFSITKNRQTLTNALIACAYKQHAT